MQIVINIPEVFGIDIEDKFQDFFSRIEAETKSHIKNGSNLVCGAYELETIQMFKESFNELISLPKGYGGLIDKSDLIPDSDYEDGIFHAVSIEQINNALTIIEAESAGV